MTIKIKINIFIGTALALITLCQLIDEVSSSSRREHQSEEARIVRSYYDKGFHFSSLEDFNVFYTNLEISQKQNDEHNTKFDDKVQICVDGVKFDKLHSLIQDGSQSVCNLKHVSDLTQYFRDLYVFEFTLGKKSKKCRLSTFTKVYVMQILSQCLLNLRDHLHQGEVKVKKELRNNLSNYVKELHLASAQKKIITVKQISKVYGETGIKPELRDLIYSELTTSYPYTMIDVPQEYYELTKDPREICQASYPYYSAVLAVASLSQLIFGSGDLRYPHVGFEDIKKRAEGATIERWISITLTCEVFRRLRPEGSTEISSLQMPGELTVKLEPIDKRIIDYVYHKQKLTIHDKLSNGVNKFLRRL